MTTPPPSRRLVASSAPATLFLLFLLAGAADAAPPLVGVSVHDEAYFATQVIACRDGSGSFPRSRLNDGYCDCTDGTDEPGTPASPEGKFYCRNIDCCNGSDEYESGIHCPNTCRNMKDIAEAGNGDRELSVPYVDDTNVFSSKHTFGIEDLIQKLRGLRMVIVIELGLVVCIFAFCFARRRTRTRRRQHILKR